MAVHGCKYWLSDKKYETRGPGAIEFFLTICYIRLGKYGYVADVTNIQLTLEHHSPVAMSKRCSLPEKSMKICI